MMKLHLYKDDFMILIRKAEEYSGISADIIEKDYYVTLMLEELSMKQEKIKAYFKVELVYIKYMHQCRGFQKILI